MINKKLSKKNNQGKWWTYGNIKVNQWGNEQASFKLDSLKELVADAEKEGKQWVNLSVFDDSKKQEKKPSQHNIDKGNGYQKELDDNVPF